jgi:nicotinamidase-related amidase
MARNLGFETYVASDATATFDRTGHDGKTFAAEEVHEVALASTELLLGAAAREGVPGGEHTGDGVEP